MLTSLFPLFYVTGEFHRFLHQGRTLDFLLSQQTADQKVKVTIPTFET